MIRLARFAFAACCCLAAVAPLAAHAAAQSSSTLHVPVLTVAPILTSDDGWGDAAHATIAWDFTNHKPAAEPADVDVAAANDALYVRFRVHQRQPLTATQTLDNVGENSDDYVTVRLWPSGQTGLVYDFRANPHGVHYQASSENVNFAPAWTSIARPSTDGYVVTMLIPLKTMRSDGRPVWRAQFERDIKLGNERDEWAHAEGQATTDQATYAGNLDGMRLLAKAAHTRPRAGVYVLGQAGANSAGGNTSRTGVDLAIPVTPTTSFVATIHPDFSTVETDQQTIAPTTFNRLYKEVRPFFAQGASFYDQSSCYGCAGWSELYTPAIPTPRDGYQLEGKQGPFTFGALDAVGTGRIDQAQALNWTSSGNIFNVGYTHVASDRAGLHDVTDFTSLRYSDQHAIVGYLETGVERGTNVTDYRKARRFDGGIAYQTRDDFIAYTMRSVGSQWNPVDGFTAVNDVAGYSAQANHTFHLKGALRTIALFEYEDHYSGSDGFGTNLIDTENQATFTFANNLSTSGFFGTSAYRVPGDPTLHPANYQGARVDYLLNTPQQSTLNYQAGHYGDGWIVVFDRIAGFRVAKRATVSLEAFSTQWRGNGTRFNQWLDRASLILNIDRETSFTIGARKLIGTAPPFPGQGIPRYQNATNLSFALSRRRPHDDIFLVYGDPNTVATTPALLLKFVHYFGADRGT